jgi:tRNA (guanine37-N1)-methyltransferase
MSWDVKILSLFPHLFPGPLSESVVGNALKEGYWSLESFNIRDYATDRHKTVDDTPYGGGSGMVMKPDVLGSAIENCFLKNNNPIIYLSPRGKKLDQATSNKLINDNNGINLLCGRFEGIDERIINKYCIIEISIGDYVLSSGDLAALVLIDACVRILPGVIDRSAEEESFAVGGAFECLLEYPHYTKPSEWKGLKVPEVLLSGNHAKISAWRLEEAKKKTEEMRPDLWELYNKRS